MMKTKLGIFFLLGYALCYPYCAFAGFEDALKAYQEKDYPKAVAEARQAASTGDVGGSFSKLAQIYMRGDGVPKNPEKALAYARQSALLGDPDGMFLLNIILKVGSLSYVDANGKPDRAKYRQLSVRPLSER